jgi:DNA end-binding protein Ku
MAQTGRVGVATYTMRGKAHLVLLRPVRDGLLLHTLYYADEVTNFAEVERPDVTVKPGELDLAVRLIDELAKPDVELSRYADEYRQRVLSAIEHKRAGGVLEASAPPVSSPTEDLMATLQRSLEARRRGAEVSSGATEPEIPMAISSRRRQAS